MEITCPSCGANAGIPIVYGYPAPDQLERSEAGEIVLGGCLCYFDDPEGPAVSATIAGATPAW